MLGAALKRLGKPGDAMRVDDILGGRAVVEDFVSLGSVLERDHLWSGVVRGWDNERYSEVWNGVG